MRLTVSRIAALLFFVAFPVFPTRAEYALLRSGQRLHITGYERDGAVVKLQVTGGQLEVPAEDVVSIEPEDFFPPTAKPTPGMNVPFGEIIRSVARKHGLEEELVASVIAVESNFNPRAVSPKLARGLMQLLPETAARYAVADVFDPAQNIEAGTRYLKDLLGRYHQDLALALAAYNAGPERVEQYRGVPPFGETRSYVRRVTQKLRERKTKPFEQRPSGGNASESLTRPRPRGQGRAALIGLTADRSR